MKLAIFHPEGNVNYNPNLTGLIALLHENGYEVHLYSRFNFGIPCQFHPDRKAIVLLYFEDIGLPFISDYNFVIGIDVGIIPAANLANMLNIPKAFLSYELMFDDELHKQKEEQLIRVKQRMVEACQNICFAVAQDKLRAQCLATEYNIDLDKIVTMPSSGVNIVPLKPSFYLHDTLGIDREKRILLYMGSIVDWSMSEWAADNAASLPDNWVMVFHGRYGVDDHFKGKYSSRNNIYFSEALFGDFSSMAPMLASASCCLALYEATFSNWSAGKNIKYIGLASGKIATALQHGIPVAVNEIGELSDIVRNNGIGAIIDTNSKSPFAILSSLDLSPVIRIKCQEIFMDKFSLNNYFDNIHKYIVRNAHSKLFDSQRVYDKYQQYMMIHGKEKIFNYLLSTPIKSSIRMFLNLILKKISNRVRKCSKHIMVRIRQGAATNNGDGVQ